MTISTEQRRLLSSVHQWFAQPEQVQQYQQGIHQSLTQAEAWLLRDIACGATVLDIGCGGGRVTNVLVQRGCRVIGTDVSRPLLNSARQAFRQTGLSVDLVEIESHLLPFADHTFDHVLLFKLYCYIPTRVLRLAYLQELQRVLVSKGSLWMIQYIVPVEDLFHAYDEPYATFAAKYTTLEPGDTFTSGEEGGAYVHWFTAQSLREELEQSGFSIALFEDDRQWGGDGFLALVHLTKEICS